MNDLETTDVNADSSTAQDVNVDSSTTNEQKIPFDRFKVVNDQKNNLARELDEIRNELQTVKNQQFNAPKAEKTEADFDYDDVAFNSYKRDQDIVNIRAEESARLTKEFEQKHVEAEFNTTLASYNQKASDYAVKNEDYNAAEKNMRDNGMKFEPHVANIVLRTNNPAVQHALMNDLQTLHNLNQMTDPTDIALAVGQVQTTLQKPVSSAPDPSPSVGNGSSNTSSSDIDKMSMEDYARYRRSGN